MRRPAGRAAVIVFTRFAIARLRRRIAAMSLMGVRSLSLNRTEPKEFDLPDNAPLILGIDFVAVPTDDFDASCRFYGDVLGLPCIARYGQKPGAEFQAGNLTLAVIQNDAFGGTFSPNSMPIALRVADVAAAREQLIAAGVRFHTEPFDSGVCHQAIFSDPAGNPLSLHHRYAEPNPAT
jgi:predicted enzyme related to lactoylglutathione lyase